MSLVSGPDSVSMASAVRMRSRIARASSAKRSESCFEVVMTSRWRSLKAARQRSRQASGSSSSSGQVRWSVSSWATASRWSGVSRLSHPSTLRVGRSWPSWGFEKWAKGDPALLALAVVGHEEQVVGGPSLALGLVGRGALLERHLAEDAAQRHHGQALRLELDEEDAPGLAGTSGRRRLISWILAALFSSIPSSSGVYSKVSSSKSSESIGQPSSSRR